jgi:hypothetical protein
MTRPEAPEGYAWREDVEAVMTLLGDQTDAILRALPDRIVARIEKERLPLPLGEELAGRLLREEFGRARTEITRLWLNFTIPSRHQ